MARRPASPPDPAKHQPTQAEMEEPIQVDGTPEEIAAAVLQGGATRREPPGAKPDA